MKRRQLSLESNMRNIFAIAISVSMMLATACTWHDGYEQIRDAQHRDCVQKFSDTERQTCMEKTKNDYAAYQRARGAQPNQVPEDFETYRRKHDASADAE